MKNNTDHIVQQFNQINEQLDNASNNFAINGGLPKTSWDTAACTVQEVDARTAEGFHSHHVHHGDDSNHEKDLVIE